MKSKSKFIVCMMTIALVGILTGCGKGNPTNILDNGNTA